MSARLGLWILLALAGGAYAGLVYFRREVPVRGRWLLALLRGAVLALLALLLLDVQVPLPGGESPHRTLLDLSPSMTVPRGPGIGPPLDSAVALLGEELRSEPVVTFGEPVRSFPDGLPSGAPEAGDSRLEPALVRAVEAGASGLRIVSDLRLTDAVAVEAVLGELAIPVEIVDVGGAVENVGISEWEVPSTARAGGVVAGTAVLRGEAGTEVGIRLRAGEVEAGDTLVTLPASGVRRVELSVPVGDEAGPLPVSVRISTPADVYGGDDERVRVVEVDPSPGSLVLVSWAPDWEPRFLLPVLEEVTGLPARGFLRVGEDRFLEMSGGGSTADLLEVADALGEARIAVAHAFPAEPPEALSRALARAPRLLRLPGGGGSGTQGGEWYTVPELPPSPVAGELAGVSLLGLPPLSGRISPPDGAGEPVLRVSRSGDGEPVPALTLSVEPGGRRAEAWVSGFWRWAFRDDGPRDVYRRTWSGVAGWLLAGDPGLREVGLAPLRTVAPPTTRMDWRAGPAAGGRVRLRWTSPDGSSTLRTDTLPVDSLGRTSSDVPGTGGVVRWVLEVLEGPNEEARGEGLLVIEDPALDLLIPRAVSLLDGDRLTGGDVGVTGGGRPLRTHPATYLLLLALLSTEWIVRRRSGLR